MNFLVDTNIATRLAEPGHAMNQAALDAVKLLVAQGHKLYIALECGSLLPLSEGEACFARLGRIRAGWRSKLRRSKAGASSRTP